MSECGFCNKEMESYEANNPHPFFQESDTRVCRACNDFVTATRLSIMAIEDEHSRNVIVKTIETVILMSFAMTRMRENFMDKVKK